MLSTSRITKIRRAVETNLITGQQLTDENIAIAWLFEEGDRFLIGLDMGKLIPTITHCLKTLERDTTREDIMLVYNDTKMQKAFLEIRVQKIMQRGHQSNRYEE